MEDLMTTDEVRALAGISYECLYLQVKTGKLKLHPLSKKVKANLFDPDEVREWVRNRLTILDGRTREGKAARAEAIVRSALGQ